MVQTNLAFGSQLGVAIPILAIDKDPSHLHGYRAAIWYQPVSWQWSQYEIFWAASFGHWWTHARHHRAVDIITVAPVLRYYLTQTSKITPFAEISIGASYLTHTRFDNRNLGMHFAFQDEIGFGIACGNHKNFTISLSTLHYSNGSLAAMNAGITIPLLINIGFKFA